jgi:glycosyltransferase involved in cell wall biosynthesis
VKLAVVVQRYGLAINGGAELHARYVAERLVRHASVEVLTTCARDYVTWRNELPEGVEQVNGVRVRRFRVARERDTNEFARASERVFTQPHAFGDELAWLEAEGPTSPALVAYAERHAADFDFFIVFTYRYYLAYHVIRAVGAKAVLVPTAERDPAIGLTIFGPVFRGVRALMYNSPEERAMIQAVAHNEGVASVVVGIGSEIPTDAQPGRFRRKFGVQGPFAVYVGRIDENKGCRELFDWFQAYLRAGGGQLTLVLIGQSLLTVPAHPRIIHLGFLDDADKFDAIAASDLLIMPSYFESLSMVALEAWALGRPVLANGRCDVLKGQCIRSDAGLYYENMGEFVETLRTLERTPWLAAALGRNGHRFYHEHYDWPVIERKYLDMLSALSEAMSLPAAEPAAGADRQRVCPAAAAVVAGIPAGWVRADDEEAPRTSAGVPMGAPASATHGRPASRARDAAVRTPRRTGGA